jgi:PAS domain S-box-containing protein
LVESKIKKREIFMDKIEKEFEWIKLKQDLLKNIVRRVNSTLELDLVIEYVIAETTKAVKAVTSTLYTLADDNKIDFSYIYGVDEKIKSKLKSMRLDLGQGIVGHVIKSGKPYVALNAADDSKLLKKVDETTSFQTKSMICVPLSVGGGVLGAVQVINKVSDDELFDDKDLELLEIIAEHAAIAIKNAQLYSQIKKILEFNKAIVENIAEGVFIVNNEMKIIEGNKALEDMSGGRYTKDFLKGRDVSEIFSYLDLKDVFKEVFKTGDVYYQSMGKNRALNFVFVPHKDDKGKVDEVITLVQKIKEE